MSVRDKIAQLVMPWMPGTYAAYDDGGFARAEAWVDSLHVGGVIVSVGSPLDVAAKLNRLQQRSALPLLVGLRLRGRHQSPAQRRDAVPTQYGRGRHRERQRGV